MPGKRQDGIRSIGCIKARCRVDDETDCWHWAGSMRGGSPRVWMPDYGPMSMTRALQLLRDGTEPTPDRTLVPTCGNVACGNPAHRVWGTKSMLFALCMPARTPQHRARLSAAIRRHRGVPESERTLILASDESCAALARKLGRSTTTVARIRRHGHAKPPALPQASVFTWAKAA